MKKRQHWYKESANVFSGDDCTGHVSFAWSKKRGGVFHKAEDWGLRSATDDGNRDIRSVAMPARVDAWFYPSDGGELVHLIGEDDEHGYPVCQSVLNENGVGANAAYVEFYYGWQGNIYYGSHANQ